MTHARLQSQTCPTDDELACFMEGQATPVVADGIRMHVDTCESCRQLIANTLRAEAAPPLSAPRAMHARTFSVGEVLNRRFRILRFIAKGGMGEVYEARDIQLGETVALKTIVCTGLDNARLFPRLRAEVQMARRVTHPNVCRILEFGTTESRAPGFEVVPYFTMEYLRGSTLKEYLIQRGKLPAAEVVTLAIQILEGLVAVHAAGIVHRDLKTENVFLVPNAEGAARAVVMDFGLARSMVTQDPGSGLSSDALVGTPAYMAPEQTMGGEPMPSWDVFSLGVVVFELLTGALPFAGKTALATAMARIRESAPPLSSSVPDIPPDLEAVVGKCLQTDPARRFTSAVSAREAFVRIRHTCRNAQRSRGMRLIRMSRGLGLLAATTLFGLFCRSSIDSHQPSGAINRDPPVCAASALSNSSAVYVPTAQSRSNSAVPASLEVSPAPAGASTAQSGIVPSRTAKDVSSTSRATNLRPKKPLRPLKSIPLPSSGESNETAASAPASPPPTRMDAADELAIPEFARRQRPMRIGGL